MGQCDITHGGGPIAGVILFPGRTHDVRNSKTIYAVICGSLRRLNVDWETAVESKHSVPKLFHLEKREKRARPGLQLHGPEQSGGLPAYILTRNYCLNMWLIITQFKSAIPFKIFINLLEFFLVLVQQYLERTKTGLVR